jgi:hypothetical protein
VAGNLRSPISASYRSPIEVHRDPKKDRGAAMAPLLLDDVPESFVIEVVSLRTARGGPGCGGSRLLRILVWRGYWAGGLPPPAGARCRAPRSGL